MGYRGQGRQESIEERHDNVIGSTLGALEVFVAVYSCFSATVLRLPKEDSSEPENAIVESC